MNPQLEHTTAAVRSPPGTRHMAWRKERTNPRGVFMSLRWFDEVQRLGKLHVRVLTQVTTVSMEQENK
jgi:hypothetical protein